MRDAVGLPVCETDPEKVWVGEGLAETEDLVPLWLPEAVEERECVKVVLYAVEALVLRVADGDVLQVFEGDRDADAEGDWEAERDAVALTGRDSDAERVALGLRVGVSERDKVRSSETVRLRVNVGMSESVTVAVRVSACDTVWDREAVNVEAVGVAVLDREAEPDRVVLGVCVGTWDTVTLREWEALGEALREQVVRVGTDGVGVKVVVSDAEAVWLKVRVAVGPKEGVAVREALRERVCVAVKLWELECVGEGPLSVGLAVWVRLQVPEKEADAEVERLLVRDPSNVGVRVPEAVAVMDDAVGLSDGEPDREAEPVRLAVRERDGDPLGDSEEVCVALCDAVKERLQVGDADRVSVTVGRVCVPECVTLDPVGVKSDCVGVLERETDGPLREGVKVLVKEREKDTDLTLEWVGDAVGVPLKESEATPEAVAVCEKEGVGVGVMLKVRVGVALELRVGTAELLLERLGDALPV